MPSTRSHLTRPRPRQTRLDLGDGDDLLLTFNANGITPAWVDRGTTRDAEEDSLSLAKALAEVMISWDVTEDDGSPYPPTAENIGVLALPIQQEILGAIIEASRPSRAEGEVSSGSSGTASTPSSSEQAALPNGQQPSPSHPSSAVPSPT